MVSVDKQALISQLCTASKLQGKDLEEYRARLNKMSETELSALISGDNKGENVDTVELNHSQGVNKTEITKKDAEDSAIQTIESNANQAIQMIDSQDDGNISEAYNKLKEKFDSDLAKSNVEKIVYKQLETAYFLKEAQANNLTYREYFEQRKELLYKTFPGIERFNDKQKQSLKRMIDSLSPEQVLEQQDKILSLPEAGTEGYDDSVRSFLNDFKTETTDSVIVQNKEFGMKVKTQPKSKFELADGERLMTFDEVYYLEQDVNFNKDNIQKYNESAGQFAFVNSVNQKREEVHQILQKPLLNIKTRSTTGTESAEMLESEMGMYVNIALEKLYGKNPEKVKTGLESITKGERLSNTDIAQRIMDMVDANYEKLTNGKSLDDYAKQMAEDYKSAYGSKDATNLASAYVQDQEGMVQNIRTGVELVGAGVMVAGMIFFPPAALAGGAVAGFGGAGVELYNESTRDNVNTERTGELKKELVINSLLMVVGMGAGKAGSAVKAALTAKNAPKLAAIAGDIGTDATISLLGDLALTGQVNIEGEGFAQFLSLVAGHKGKIVSGIKHVKDNIKAKFGPDARQMPDGTIYKVNQDGSTTVLEDAPVKREISDNTTSPKESEEIQVKEETETINEQEVPPETPNFKHFSREEIDALKKQDKNVKEMSNGDVFRIGDDGSFTKIGTTKAPLKDASVDLSNTSADKAKSLINDFIKNNQLEDIKDPVIKNKILELQNNELDGKTKQKAMALLNVFKAFRDNNIDTKFSQNTIDFITVDNYTRVIDYIKANKGNFDADKCVADITKDIVKSNKTTKQLFNRSMALADNPEMENKFATVIYNTINSSAGDMLASQVKLINKMNDNVLKTYINSMSKTMARVDEATIKTLNNIEPEVLEKYVSKYLNLMDQVPTDKFANLIKGFENMPGGMASHIDSKIEQKIIDSILLDNKGLIDVFNKTKPEIFDKIPDDVKVELSNKIHVYTDKKHIAEAVDFIETPKFKEIENTIKSKFPYIYNENFEAKLKAYYIANNTGNPDDFIKYVENINVKELMEISPRIAKFEEEQLIEFLNYHHQKGTELTAENLTYQGSLTKDMQKDLMDYDKLSQVLSRFPNTDRRIGHLPQEWINGIPKEKQRDFANNIYEKINEFVTSNKDATSTAKLQSDLSQMFGENVLVQELGTGNYGTGYKITVGNRKPFVLKAFNEASNDFKGYNVHGQTIEPQNAMYAKGRSNDFAGFYFGRAADKFDNDGFMLVEFLPKKTGPEKPRDLSIQRLTSADFDAEQNHNFQNGKIIDYGAMMPVDKKLLEDKGVARYTRIITENMIALKGSDTYGFNDVRLNIVKNAVQKADNPMQVVEAINVIEHNVVKNIDEKSLQELKQIKKDVFIKYIKAKKPDVDAEAYFAAYDLNDKISNIENMIRNSFKGTGLNQGVTFSSRTKSVQSMYDKIHSNMKDKHLSLDEALKKVQDGYGLRTIMEDFDYKKYPEIVEMYKKDPEKAYRMAAEKQSEHIVEMLKEVLTRQINSGDFEIMTLSNYKGQDGIPYLSDKQVKELMEYANQRGVKLDVKTDDNGFAENVKDSGYTAFQMNLKYKDGTVVEWQTRGSDVDKFAEVEHIMYDSRQDKDLTGGRDVLKPLYEPYKKLIKDMKDDMFNEHMEYLTEYYKQLRLKELGFNYKLPEMNPKFDPRISAENLFKLHDEKERILHNQRK